MSAFIFDLNGTIIDDMPFHVKAWSQLLNGELNANMDYEAVKAQMYGKNSELLTRVFGPDRFTDAEMDELSIKKETIYQAIYREHMQLINGLGNFLEKAQQLNIPMAIGSAAIMFNINYILDGLNIRKYFKEVVSNVRDSLFLFVSVPESISVYAILKAFILLLRQPPIM